MSGNKAGGLKAAATNKKKYGKNFYKRLGQIGGHNGHAGGFAADPERAKRAGAIGGKRSKRGPGKRKGETEEQKDKRIAETHEAMLDEFAAKRKAGGNAKSSSSSNA